MTVPESSSTLSFCFGAIFSTCDGSLGKRRRVRLSSAR
ncbi:PEP-CTERM sorting domain-containing protein [Bradyrhizobium elkanii]|uniref:PEP-CTERM sorting domain-containing protein n=1 Tax=Bradyrhizobium elkanii TaxID=29448 RepID=A0A4U6RXT7_BRAEL|nr:PEP-CTERM sorting domain-containing protein [Bradyrhizobium sp. BR2003]TKV78472.1 PEP-CTERM sorting domain-containing protein [Bradyrhizobium elkanii]